jgi:hypothetical protein
MNCRYYKDATKDPRLKKTLIITGVNNGYRDFLLNFKCYADRLGTRQGNNMLTTNFVSNRLKIFNNFNGRINL